MTTIDSKSILYNRESSLPSSAFYDIHEQIPWTADVNFTQVETSLKTVARQDVLDKFMMKTYKNPNDYRTIILQTLRKGVMRTIEDKLIYGNIDNDSAEFDGIGHLLPADIAGGEAWAAANSQAYDAGGAAAPVSIKLMRELIDAVRPKPNFLLMTRNMRNTLSATAFEKGIVLTSISGSGPQYGLDKFGARIEHFDGIPIVISDYMLNETDNTVNYNASDSDDLSSIWAIRVGNLIDGGLTLVTGGETGGMDFYMMTELDVLEDYDAGGIRLVAYTALAQGSSKATAVIHSVDELQVIVG